MPRLNDEGFPIILTITKESDGAAYDVSAATTKQILLKPADGGALLTKTASLYTDGTDGKLSYATETGILSVVGTWYAQAYTIVGSVKLRSTIVSFEVERVLS